MKLLSLFAITVAAALCQQPDARQLTYTWTQQPAVDSPPARWAHAMAYDPIHKQVVLFGGAGPNYTDVRGDTWVWDGSNWTQKFPTHSPSARAFHRMIWDPTIARVLLYGGGGIESDTWSWDGIDWALESNVGSNGARSSFGFVYDTAAASPTVFGGYVYSAGTFTNDTWKLPPGAAWQQLSPATVPPARENLMMVYDTWRSRTVMFGGWVGDLSGTYYSDLWIWDGANWSELRPATRPRGRRDSVMEFDAVNGVILLFSGSTSDGLPEDTWLFNGVFWQKLSPAVSPGGRMLAAMAYDGARQQFVMFGGLTSTFGYGDTWTLQRVP